MAYDKNKKPETAKKVMMNVVTPIKIENQEKPFWQNVGKAFVNSGGSISIKLNALPVNGELVLFEDKGGDNAK